MCVCVCVCVCVCLYVKQIQFRNSILHRLGVSICLWPKAEVYELHVSVNLSAVQLVRCLHRMCEVTNN